MEARNKVEAAESAEVAWEPDGKRVRVRACVPKDTPILKISGSMVGSPGPATIQADRDFHFRDDGAPWESVIHSCDPNCAIDFNSWTFYSKRPIQSGELLTYDYFTTEWEMAAPFRCACGSENCRGFISGFKHLPVPRQEELARSVSPFLLRRLFEQVPLRDALPSNGVGQGWSSPVYVFIPYAVNGNWIESFDYDIPAFRAEVQSWFDALDLPWRWVPITRENLGATIETLRSCQAAGRCMVFNLCDGSDIDGSPGVSVVRALEQAHIPFTGGSSHFYWVTTSKVLMKRHLARAGIPIPAFVPLRDLRQDIPLLEEVVGYPALVKPEVSCSSNGISLKSLVFDPEALAAQVLRLFESEDGEFYKSSGVFAERFVDGPEFTVLVVGNHAQPEKLRVYHPAERIFHSALPARERFLSHDRYWSEYLEEPRLPEGEPFYRYGLAGSALSKRLEDLALRAFLALQGTGYARVDIRMESRTGELSVLEVNSNCGLSGDRETSVGEILHLTGTPVHRLISEILQTAADRPSPETAA